jgi:hypothetical protein
VSLFELQSLSEGRRASELYADLALPKSDLRGWPNDFEPLEHDLRIAGGHLTTFYNLEATAAVESLRPV